LRSQFRQIEFLENEFPDPDTVILRLNEKT